MSKAHSAENFAKERHSGMTGKDGASPYHEHLAAVVARLKNLGISEEDVISSAWLHDIIDHSKTSFDELDQRFGSRVAVLVLSVSVSYTHLTLPTILRV